jgi:hypothetical protein
MKKFILTSLALSLFLFSKGQANLPFEIELDTMNIFQLGGIQSYVFGQSDGKWLIVGGRLDGLHKRQPFASFDPAGNNNNLIVIDPLLKQKWSAPLTSLPASIQEQLSSTNMCFYQTGDYLYCIGGYGFSAKANDHTTYPNLTSIEVSKTIQAVIDGSSFTSFFKQIQNSKMQVTGGKLKKINDRYYLLGGQKFLGRYNPMGPNNGPGFIQEYTNAVRVFDIKSDANQLPQILNFKEWIDTPLFHRRDYNAEPQILSNGKQGIMMFSGVFRTDADLPYLNTISISDDGSYKENAGFRHLLHNYHCPVAPIYSESNQSMYNIFFGGIAQYYYENGVLMKDDNVPFVKTISCVSRDKKDSFVETKLGIELSEFLGAGAEFIPVEGIPAYDNRIQKLDAIPSGKELIGYIYGGISSTAANIFFSNGNDLSKASSMIFKVYLKKKATSQVIETNSSAYSIYPNPFSSDINIELADDIEQSLHIYNMQGQRLKSIDILRNSHKLILNLADLPGNSWYLLRFSHCNHTMKLFKK